jgi:hypothetical protein
MLRGFPMMPFPSRAGRFHRSIPSYAFAILVFCAGSLLLASSASAQSNAITLPRNLAELVSESHVVVQGWVTGVTLEPHDQLKNLMTVVVTLQVEETLKGENLKTLTFRQAVIDKRDQQQYLGYRTGQHLLLVLMKPSKYGLTSPAGMEQGRFRIEPAGAGKLSATNGFSNAGLFHELDTQLHARGIRVVPEVRDMIAKPGANPVPLDHLKSLIRAVVAADSMK